MNVFHLLLTAFLTVQALDTTTTIVGLRRGLREANPLFGERPPIAVVIGVKVGGATAAGFAFHILHKSHPRATKVVMLATTVLTAAVVVHNIQEIRRQ